MDYEADVQEEMTELIITAFFLSPLAFKELLPTDSDLGELAKIYLNSIIVGIPTIILLIILLNFMV